MSRTFACTILILAQLTFGVAYSQPYKIRIVNMIQQGKDNEVNNDTEPNIAVNPANPNIIAASAFTPSLNRVRSDGRLICDTFPCPDTISRNFRHRDYSTCRAPVYFSIDGGETWILKDVLPSNNGITFDISLAFSEAGYLYVSFLKGCEFGRTDLGNLHNNLKGFMVYRSNKPLNDSAAIDSLSVLEKINDFSGRKYDMPWVIAMTSPASNRTSAVVPTGSTDHVFVGVNDFSNAITQNQNPNLQGRSATVIVCNDGVAARVNNNNFNSVLIETQPQYDKNPAGIRLAAHSSGKVYALCYRVKRRVALPRQGSAEQCDVLLMRDDDLGRSQFRNLLTRGVSGPPDTGAVVEAAISLPLHYMSGSLGFLAGNRITGSDLAIAVDPGNSNHVFVAWCSLDSSTSSGQKAYTLHFRHNKNKGEGNWLSINRRLDKIKNAFNPAIAITDDGRVGFLYQQLTEDCVWETHFVMAQIRVDVTERDSSQRNFNPIQDRVLSRFRKAELDSIPNANRRHLSDYLDLQAVSNTFYGVFASLNTPDPIHDPDIRRFRFPAARPRYQRDQSRLLRIETTASPIISPSIDPFFFKIEPIRR